MGNIKVRGLSIRLNELKEISNYLSLIIYFVLSYAIHLDAQPISNIRFENITTQNGLSSNSVHQVIQDNKGFLWCASYNGLNRFDGVNFHVLKHDENNEQSIKGNHVRAIHKDERGYLWIGTLKNGISRYDFARDTYKHFQHQKNDISTLSDNQILCFYEDSKGQLWVGTENGLNLFNYKKETFSRFLPSKKPNTLSKSAVITLSEDDRGWLWAGTWAGGLNLVIPIKYPKKNKKYIFRHFEHKSDDPASIPSNNIWSFFKDKSNRFWVGTFNGGFSLMLPNKETDPHKFEPQFVSYQKKNVHTQRDEPIDNLIFTMNQDHEGNMWIGTSNGLSLFHPDTYFSDKKLIDPYDSTTIPVIQFQHFQHNKNDLKSLPNSEITNIFIDKDNIVWCSTIGGIGKFDPNSIRFQHFLSSDNLKTNLSASCILELKSDMVFVGTKSDYGLVQYNPIKKTYKSYVHQPNNSNSIAENNITCFYKSSEDSIFIGTWNGISIFNPKTEQFSNLKVTDSNGKIIKNINPKGIFKDKGGQYWIASEMGLFLFNPKKNQFKGLNKVLKFVKKIPNMNEILQDDKGNIWVASYEALYKIKVGAASKLSLQTYLHDSEDPHSICSNRIIALSMANGTVWAGTEDGLAKYNPKTDNFDNITSKEGLKNPGILGLEVDNNNILWASTREGLLTIDPITMTIRAFDEKDGLQNNTFNYFSSYKNEKGLLYFGGINGYNSFYGENISLNRVPPPIYITGVKTFNQSKHFKKAYTDLKAIELSYKENYFTIEFSALNFIQAEENQYAYKLEGVDKDWVYCGQRNFASYTNLDGGTYTFYVKAANNDNFWNEKGITLKVTVIPPYLKTWWFTIVMMLFLITSIGLIYKRRVYVIKQQQIELEKEVVVRTTEIASQKKEIEHLVMELQSQNELLEEKVKERTKNLELVNKDLIRSNKDLEQFAYIASHDLQEPLRMVGNFVQLLEYKYKKKIDQDGRDYIRFTVEGVQRMSSLIKSLLSYSRVGRSDSTFSNTDLNTIVKNKTQDLSLLIKEKNVEMTIHPLPNLIICEKEQMGIVFYNLINNAIKFNKKDLRKVEVGLVEEDDNYWTFYVKDNGIGIEMNYRQKVFEIFKRLNRRDEFEGTGIGLAICKRIVNRHDGNIWFESETDKGTTFYFTISKKLENVS